MGILGWILTLAILGGIGYGAYWYYTEFMTDDKSSNGLFGGGREKRLGVLDQASVDGRRKLVLIKRDNVEHLIMTGGPVDVVIETGIPSGGKSLPQRDKMEEVSMEPRESGELSFGTTARRAAQTLDK